MGSARITGVLITSATFPYLVRRLGVDLYGVWSYIVAVCALFQIVADPGLNTYSAQKLASQRQQAFELLPDVFLLKIASSIVAWALLNCVALFEPRAEIRYLLVWYGGGLLLTNLVGATYILDALEKFHLSSALTIAQQVLYATGVFLFVRSPKDLHYLAASILVSAMIANLSGWWFLVREGMRLRLTIQPARLWRILLPSLHYALSSLMSSLYHRSGHILVRWFLGDHALGLYAAAARLVDILRHLVTIVLNVMTPRMALAKASDAVFTRIARVAASVVAVVSLPLAFGLMATAQYTVPWLLGSQYADSASLLKWIAPYVVTASSASFLSGSVLYSRGDHRAYLRSTLGGAISGILLYLVLIPAIGIKGACVAYVSAELVVATIAWTQIPSQLRGMWRSPIIGAAVISVLLMLVAINVVDGYTVRPAIIVSAGAVAYTLSCGWYFKNWIRRELEQPS